MVIWIDAQISPAIAAWINENYPEHQAQSVRQLGLRDALDQLIFQKAKDADVVVMTKDVDFVRMQEQYGPPPKLIWITCGNSSNIQLKNILSKTLQSTIELFTSGEKLVEIRD